MIRGPASDHLHRLHEKMQAAEGRRSESPLLIPLEETGRER